MKGLIIKSEWLECIFNKDFPKTWEIRRTATKIRGKIMLIESGSEMIVGECEVKDSIALNEAVWYDNFYRHQVCNPLLLPEVQCCPWAILQMRYKKPHAWVLANIKQYEKPIPYKHPQGAVIWVNLDEE